MLKEVLKSCKKSADVKAYKNNSKRSSDCILQIYKYLTSTFKT